jgi:hypothetical protein
MAKFYIQLADKLLSLNTDITSDAIIKSLGYTPSDFSGKFSDLTESPILINESFNILNENNEVIAKFNANGLEVSDVVSGIHKLSEKVDKGYVDNKIIELIKKETDYDFELITNNPILVDESGELLITDDSGNIGMKLNSSGLSVTNVIAGEHSLVDKIDKDDLDDAIDSLQSVKSGSGSYVKATINQNKGVIDSVVIDDSNIKNLSLPDLKNFPIVENESGLLEIVDDNGNKILVINNNGVLTTGLTIGAVDIKTTLSELQSQIDNLRERIAALEN